MFIVTAKEMYDIDDYTMEVIGLPGALLMENAGRELYRKVRRLIRNDDRIVVLVGAGNNGGDGFVVARYLLEQGNDVFVVQAVPGEKISGDALMHKQIYVRSGGRITLLENAEMGSILENVDVLIDALLGIGFDGRLREPFPHLIDTINESSVKVISVDIPSGVPANEGITVSTAVRADFTFSIGAAKMSAVLPGTATYYGEWEVIDIGFSKTTLKKYSERSLYQWKHFASSLPERNKDAHKGDHGRGLVIGGSAAMPGAITMATRAALVAGAGLITAATIKENIPIIACHVPEAMFQVVQAEQGWLTEDESLDFTDYNAVAVGVGMGRSERTEKLIKQVLEQVKCPVLIDADGLFHLKQLLPILKRRKEPVILTPHAGELARLLEVPVEELLEKPFYHTKEFVKKYGVYLVLKGPHTIITNPALEQVVDSTGNPGLAKGGSGDVLTGIMLAMIMQKQILMDAICNACFLHGTSADYAVQHEHSVHDLLATDILKWIRQVYRTVSL